MIQILKCLNKLNSIPGLDGEESKKMGEGNLFQGILNMTVFIEFSRDAVNSPSLHICFITVLQTPQQMLATVQTQLDLFNMTKTSSNMY